MTTETKEELAEITPEDLFNKLLEDVAAHQTATEAFVANFSFYGRTLKEHADALWIEVPKKMTPEQYRDVFTQLAHNIQIASHFYVVASTISNALSGGNGAKKADLMKAIAETYDKRNKRRPGVDLIDKMADSYMSGTVSVTIAARIVKDFWKQKLESLIEVRKCVEQIGLSQNMEMKYIASM